MKKLALTLPVVTVLVGAGLVAAELAAGAALEREVRERVTALAPGAQVTSADVRGRPHLASWATDRVSTAYLTLAPTAGVARSTVLVQELDLDSGTAQRVRTLVWLPYPERSTTPVLARDGSYTDSARVDGSVVRFDARLDGDRIETSARGGKAPSPVRVDLPSGSTRITGVSAMEEGVAVEVVAADVATTAGPATSR